MTGRRSTNRNSHGGEKGPSWQGVANAQLVEEPRRYVTIGLINNMPDTAFEATERQFVSLIGAAAGKIAVRLKFYSLPGIPRSGSVAEIASRSYESTEALWGTRLDGLIVTGREPLKADLRQESYWESFTEVLDWARSNTYSTVWSCLAAHAAILHMDGIGRRRSDRKHFGVLKCERLQSDALMAGVPANLQVPHSRWNGVAEEELKACGYDVLARTEDAGVDTFAKEVGSLFVFFQGHPEYESDTLMREYRRDVGRFLRGEMHHYPLMPLNYFDGETTQALHALCEKAADAHGAKLLPKLAAVLNKARIESKWTGTAARVYRNWLQLIEARKNALEGVERSEDVARVAYPVAL